MVIQMKCPRCGSESESTGKKWKYNVFDVEGHYCERCDKNFYTYFRNGKLNHTIPKRKKN